MTQSEYKETFENTIVEDSHLFITSYVPFQLITKSMNDEEVKTNFHYNNILSNYCRSHKNIHRKQQFTSINLDL